MDEREFGEAADGVFARLVKTLDALDPDDVEVDRGGGYLTLTFRDRSRCVINSQRPAREIWMAADETAWHFGHGPDGRWVAGKTGEELFATVAAMIHRKLGTTVSF